MIMWKKWTMIGVEDDLEGGKDNKRRGSKKPGKTTIERWVVTTKCGRYEI
jgi:hypothetical protein